MLEAGLLPPLPGAAKLRCPAHHTTSRHDCVLLCQTAPIAHACVRLCVFVCACAFVRVRARVVCVVLGVVVCVRHMCVCVCRVGGEATRNDPPTQVEVARVHARYKKLNEQVLAMEDLR